jgi:aerobic-type carbon monoxide dehydrogenase small subunit (CoxS/CutS family)
MTPPSVSVNGRFVPLQCEDRTSLADHLRDSGFTTVHLGCEHGVCGACNVMMDGASARACLMMARSCAGAKIFTLEGLTDPLATRLRAAFSKHHALQCGFCTPGVFIAAHELLSRGVALDESTVRDRLSGNICRCTGYQGIVDAILDVAGAVDKGNA